MLLIKKISPVSEPIDIQLPYSKSILNRLLIINELGGFSRVFNLDAQSNDVKILFNALKTKELHIDFEDAGTPLRLFLAYASLTKKEHVVIDGNLRLRERPLLGLLTALENLGAKFEYLEEYGKFPLRIVKGVDVNCQSVAIDASKSSQFISALLLIAPCFNNGLLLRLEGEHRSRPYIDMTIETMRSHGVQVTVNDNTIRVEAGKYKEVDATVEADWSSAAFIYAFASMSKTCDISLPGLILDSSQGDKACMTLFDRLGVSTSRTEDGVRLGKKPLSSEVFNVDFKDIPDLFPVVLSVAVAKGLRGKFTGIRNLRDKESDRIEAMIENLTQVGADFELSEDSMTFYSGILNGNAWTFNAYNDHRVAMACAIWAYLGDISIYGEESVGKSFPDFWNAFGRLGARITKEISE